MSGAGLVDLSDASHLHDRGFLLPLCKASGLLATFTPRGFCTFAQFAEAMTAALADLREFARSLSAFAAF